MENFSAGDTGSGRAGGCGAETPFKVNLTSVVLFSQLECLHRRA
jgi:hypothetical protein